MALDPSLPFSHAQGVAAGMSWRELAGRGYQRPLHGVYLRADVELTPLVRAQAALVATGGRGAIYGVSAAEIRELPVPVSEDTHMLFDPDEPRCRVRGIVSHRGTRKMSSYRGVPLTAMVDTFLDVAHDYPLIDAVVLGDALVKGGYATPGALIRAATADTRRGAERARRAAALVRPRVMFPQETRLRLLMVLSGLPEPVTGFPVVAAGRKRELDTAYEQWKVAVEYDGRHHVERDLQWSEDIERHEDLDGEQWKVVIVTGMQMFDPDRVLTRIRTALTNAGASLPPSSQEWRRHFPTRRRPTRD